MTWLLLFFVVNCLYSQVFSQYQPTWDSLDRRPTPQWYDDAKIGVMIHWGVFSVPSFSAESGQTAAEWFWEYWVGGNPTFSGFMEKNFRPGFTYPDFAPMFRAELFDPNKWADILQASGAKYLVLTAKHHEGFTNWPSDVSWNWNSVEIGPKRDLVGELAVAMRKRTDVRFGLYHSLFEWFNPLYLKDKANNYSTQTFIRRKTMPELYELITKYKPELIWSDGDWMAPFSYWNSTEFIAWLYNQSPVKDTVVVNDRWGIGTNCKHGSYFTCKDRYDPGTLQKYKWENVMSLDKKSFGNRRNAPLSDIFSMPELLQLMARTISCGGNLLVNIGPTASGQIILLIEERLRQLGTWLKVNGESVYASRPWTYQNDTITPNLWYTSKKTATGTDVYAFFFIWPRTPLILGAASPSSSTSVSILGLQGRSLSFKALPGGGMAVTLPVLTPGEMPCEWGWVLKLKNLATTTGPNAPGWRMNSLNQEGKKVNDIL